MLNWKLLLLVSVIFKSQMAGETAVQAPSFFDDKHTLSIHGRVVNYTQNNENSFIQFSTVSAAGIKKDTSIYIDKNGTFTANLPHLYSGDFTCSYKGRFYTFYASVNEMLELTIMGDKSPKGNMTENISCKGKYTELNRLLFDYNVLLRKHHFNTNVDIGNKKQNDAAFCRTRIKRMTEEMAFLDSFTHRENKADGTFKIWAANDIMYSAANDILFFPFAGKLNTTIDFPVLMTYLATIPVNNKTAFGNTTYYLFLRNFSRVIQQIVNLNPVYQREIRDNGMDETGIYLKKIDELSSGLSKQVLYYDLFLSVRPQQVDPFLNSYYRVVTDTYLKSIPGKRPANAAAGAKRFNVVEKIKQYKVDDTLKKKLADIFAAESGKTIFIDFWGSWCAPCMSEMPHYKKLIDSYTGKPISFIFFGVDTPPENAREIMNRNGIEAKYFSLNNAEIAILTNIFNFSSYPTHLLIDKNGFMHARPWSIFENGVITDTVKETINKLL